MSNLDKYIKKTKEFVEKNNLTETETIRYIYLDLGKRFSFDLNYMYGNRRMKEMIYMKSINADQLEKSMDTNIIICRTSSLILDRILNGLGIKSTTICDRTSYTNPKHVYNLIKEKSGRMYIIDLQQDLENIQSHSFTPNFGLSFQDPEKSLIDRFEIEQMDKKLDYIRDDFYYSDDYLYLLKSDIGYFDNLQEKVNFVLKNLEIYSNPNMKFPERRSYHEALINKLFSRRELDKIHFVEYYKETLEGGEYKNGIAIERKNSSDIYLYSNKLRKYQKVTMKKFAEEISDAIDIRGNVPGLKQYLRKKANKNIDKTNKLNYNEFINDER